MPLSLFYKEKSGAFSFGFPRLPPPSSCQVPMPDSQRIRYLLSITQVLSLCKFFSVVRNHWTIDITISGRAGRSI